MKINGIGCSLVDNLYSPVDFTSAGYRKWTAESGTTDGLITGGLIFGDSLEKSSGVPYSTILNEITGGNIRPNKNVGGPAVVAIIHMSQILEGHGHSIGFYGSMGNDSDGKFISDKLSGFNMDTSGYIITDGHTPFTDVLSDPAFNNNNGERTFINYIGAAGNIRGGDLSESFFDADILIYGGTGLVPGIHDDLSFLLENGKKLGKINCVNTVYDFRNQKKNPGAPWPLVSKPEDFGLIDLLIADREEAIRISGKTDKTAAAEYFLASGIKSGLITHGAEDTTCFSDGSFFHEKGIFTLPVSKEAGELMRNTPVGSADTTGCGDNFAGGVYTSLVQQLSKDIGGRLPSLKDAAAFGTVSGGFAGLYRGGVYYEEYTGQKSKKIQPLLESYRQQIGGL